MRTIIYPYNMKSLSAKLLAEKLNGLRVYPDKIYVNKNSDLVINWGNTTTPRWLNKYTLMLNMPQAIENTTNKHTALTILKRENVPVPEFTHIEEEARKWVQEKNEVVIRTILTGHSGKGIKIATMNPNYDKDEDYIELIRGRECLTKAPLYTKFINTYHEARLHISGGKLIDFQKKRRKTDGRYLNPRIKNLKNGWVYCRENFSPNRKTIETAMQAITALGLDFGAVDIIGRGLVNSSYDIFVLEVNTAPGLTGATLESYVRDFKKIAEICNAY